MDTSLGKGDRVRIVLDGGAKKHLRVLEWAAFGCLSCTCPKDLHFEAGAPIEMEQLAEEPKRIFYMQVYAAPHAGEASLLLRRNPSASFNIHRRGWRVNYTAPTAVRGKGATHFLSAQFCNMSLEAAGFLSETRFPVDAPIELRLALPENPPQIVTARVRRVSETPLDKDSFGRDMYGVVACFESLPFEALRHLTHFMWQRIRKQYPHHIRELYNATQRRRTAEAPSPGTVMQTASAAASA